MNQLAKVRNNWIIYMYTIINILPSVYVGEFGIVYKGKLSKGFNTSFSEIVAIKTLKGCALRNLKV